MPEFTKQQLEAQALRAANPVTPEQQMQIDQGNNEFELSIAPNLNYQGSGVSGDNAHYVGTPGISDPLTLRGFVGTGSGETLAANVIDGVPLVIPDGPAGSANAIGANAKPKTWAHEFRHIKFPSASEGTIRLYDAYNAQNEDEWRDAVMMYGQHNRLNTMDEAEKRLIDQLRSLDKEKNESMNDNPWWKRQKFSKVEEET
jgi:hypothetical protein